MADRTLSAVTADAPYSAGELAAIDHMVRTPGRAVYHVLRGARDLWLLGRASRRNRHREVATFRQALAAA